MRRLALAFLFAMLVTGCGVHVRAGVPHPPPEPPPPPPSAPAARVLRAPEVRAKEIEARYVRARVIYAKEVRANGGRIGRIEGWHDGHSVGRGKGKGHGKGHGRGHDEHHGRGGFAWGSHELSVPEVHADTIYVKELRADWIDAEVIVAKDVDIGH